MKIVCGSCQAKYSIADEKVAGKVFKIRCKRCSEVIVVRGDQVIQFKVEIPKKLTSRQEELLRELAGELGEAVKDKRSGGLFGRKK